VLKNLQDEAEMPRKRTASLQTTFPGEIRMERNTGDLRPRKKMILHRAILKEISSRPGAGRSVPEIYRQDVLPTKTRTIPLLGRKTTAKIIHSLLGYEVQASYKRIHCPDLVTARYIKLFRELGCRRVRLPYDPTITEKLLPELESAQERLFMGIRGYFPGARALQGYVIRQVCSVVRSQLRAD
jgi:hypothetical protein